MNPRYILVLLFMCVSTYAYADDAYDCAKSSGDTQINACTRGIESGHWQGANLGAAYDNRGNAKKNKGDFDGAIADYNRAIELNPQDAGAYNNRGIAKKNKGDLDGAIADFNRAIELNPRLSEAYNNRGNAKKNKGDLDGAIADYNRAIELNPQDADAYSNRGNAYYYQGNFAHAGADLAHAYELDPDIYTALWLYLAQSRNGSKGKNELIKNVASLDTSKWPAPIVALYLGTGTPSTVFSAVENPDAQTRKDQRCEANFYVGSWQLLKGDRKQALSSLRAARDGCPKTFIEYTGAVYELKRLGMLARSKN